MKNERSILKRGMRLLPLIAGLFLFCQTTAFAQTATDIMDMVDNRYDGDTVTSETVMVLIDKNKKRRVRHLKSFSKDYGKDIKTVIFFLSPADVRNTASLSYNWDDNEKDDDTWLYLPVLRKSKRIASSDKSGSYMGSDFTYSDLNGLEVEDWDFKFDKIKEELVDGKKSWVITGRPRADKKNKVIQETGYLRLKLWVRKDINMIVKGKYWVKKGKKIKYYEANNIKKLDGIWTAKELKMILTKRKKVEHVSVIIQNNVTYNLPIKDGFFTLQQMERGI